MLNRISAVTVSATLIAVGTLAFLGVIPGNNSSLRFEKIGYEQSDSSLLTSDRSSFSLPTKNDLSKSNIYFCYPYFNWCY